MTGVVIDGSGAVTPDAEIELIHLRTNTVRRTVSNAVGIYRFDAVDLGAYDLAARKPGFNSSIIRDFPVRANQVTSIDIQLEVGETQTTVEVTASVAPVLQMESPVRGGNTETQQILHLPYASRNPVSLALIFPGVSTNRYGSGVGTFSSNGARQRANNFLLDGTENNDISITGQSFQFINPEAVEEVSIQTANHDSEFGRAGGAIVNVISKSGSNNLHGSLLYLLDSTFDDAITASQAQNPDVIRRGRPLPGTDQWYSATLGGPVVRDQTFFFGSFLERRQSSQALAFAVVPSEQGRTVLNSLFPRGASANLDHFLELAGGVTATSNFFPVRMGPGRPDVEFGNWLSSFSHTARNRQGLGRLDHHLSERTRLFLRYGIDDQYLPYGGERTSFPSLVTSQLSRNQSALVSGSHVFSPSLTTELRLAFNRYEVDLPLDSENPLGQTSPLYNIQGITIPNGFSVGIRNIFPQGRTANNTVVQSTTTKIVGSHALRFGLDLLDQRSAQLAPIPSRGVFTYNQSGEYSGFANFVEDFAGSNGAVMRTFGDGVYYPTFLRQAYFLHDRWRATRNLTVSLGVRYEYFGAPFNAVETAAWAGLFNVDPATFDGPFRLPNKVQSDRNNFAPMVGLAWSPSGQDGVFGRLFGSKRTVFRAGYSLGYDVFFNNMASNSQNSTPNALATQSPPSQIRPDAPRGLANLSALMPRTPRAPTPLDAQILAAGDLVNPYVQRWSAGLQRELPGRIVLDIGYVGTKGTKLFITEQLNPAVPESLVVLPQTAEPIPASRRNNRIDGLQGSRTIRTNGGDSNYHGAQIFLNRRFSGGFSATAAYTFSKMIDNMSDSFQMAAISQTTFMALPGYFGGLQLDRGLSVFDRKHRAVFSYVYELPFYRSQRGAVGRVLGGWQLAGVTTFESGVPFNIINGQDADGIEGFDRPDYNPLGRKNVRAIPSAASPTGYINPDAGNTPINPMEAEFIGLPANTGRTPGRTGNLGRNVRRTPGISNFDVAAVKRVTVNERWNLELRGESYNVFNHPQWGTPSVSPFGVGQSGVQSNVMSTPGGRFLRPDLGDGGGRVIRYQLKISF